MPSSWIRRLLLATAAIAITTAPAIANSTSDVLTIKVVVEQSCLILSNPLDFGTYSAGQQPALEAEGIISYVGCGPGTLTISLDGGTSGKTMDRKMSSGNSKLSYQLYRNSARNEVWGNGSDAFQRPLLEPGAGSVTVYGRIPGGQTVAGGTYIDTVNLTLSF